ncbi:MAG: methyltransferase [Alphaproteobacteria bacterium]|nr:methyltransferase [Alphaproteobacteria bacterium]MDE2110700.1 methyltransferase [Alphaproteobacteria bacterium]MDE2494505.1 methyltransferase [Alphaproteobacteria bacterium]
MTESSEDRFLGGRLTVRQPVDGFRAGLDAVMLAAAIPAAPGDDVLELGAGTGVASLCLAHRIENATITGLEIDERLTDTANANASANGMTSRVLFVTGNALDPPAACRKPFNHVFCNPPFHEGQVSPDAARARALQDEGRLADWLAAGLKRTATGGTFTLILRADRLGEALAALPARGAAIFPLWPRAGETAKRVIVQLRNGARTPLAVLPGLLLHEADGRYTKEADAVLRDGASLALDSRRL